MQHREDETQVAGNRRLPGEQRLNALLYREVAAVDLVVERDHLVGEVLVLLDERGERAAQRPQYERPLFMDRRFELVELFLERDAALGTTGLRGSGHQPNLPVT